MIPSWVERGQMVAKLDSWQNVAVLVVEVVGGWVEGCYRLAGSMVVEEKVLLKSDFVFFWGRDGRKSESREGVVWAR